VSSWRFASILGSSPRLLWLIASLSNLRGEFTRSLLYGLNSMVDTHSLLVPARLALKNVRPAPAAPAAKAVIHPAPPCTVVLIKMAAKQKWMHFPSVLIPHGPYSQHTILGAASRDKPVLIIMFAPIQMLIFQLASWQAQCPR